MDGLRTGWFAISRYLGRSERGLRDYHKDATEPRLPIRWMGCTPCAFEWELKDWVMALPAKKDDDE